MLVQMPADPVNVALDVVVEGGAYRLLMSGVYRPGGEMPPRVPGAYRNVVQTWLGQPHHTVHAFRLEDTSAALAQLAPEDLARLFHETYEELAPTVGYETRKDSAVPWDMVPETNKALMVAVATKILESWPQLAVTVAPEPAPVAV